MYSTCPSGHVQYINRWITNWCSGCIW